MNPLTNLLTSIVTCRAPIRKRGRPLWLGSQITDVDCAQATYRGLCFIYRTALNPTHFAEYGSDYLWCFYSIAASVKDAKLRSMALRMGAERARLWRLGNFGLPYKASAATVIAVACGHDAAGGLNVPDDELKADLKRAASRFSARELLRFDPLREPPPSDVPESCEFDKADNPRGSTVCRLCQRPLSIRSRYDVWYDALTTTHTGDRIGVKLGAHYDDVLRWLPMMRPYHGRDNGINPEFDDALYAVTHVVYTLNDYNSFKLDPSWLPEEFAFLKASLHEAIAQQDEDMLGEIMDGLRAFGLTNDDEIMRAGMEYLLSHQNANGSWGTEDEMDIYSLYHPTWCAVSALSELATQEYSSRLNTTPVLPISASPRN